MEAKIYTTPDLDRSNKFKVLLVDFDWETIESFTDILSKVPEPITVYLFGANDTDYDWCLDAAFSSDAILVNCARKGEIELIKGYILALISATPYRASNKIATAIKESEWDFALWLTKVLAAQDRRWIPKRA
jgi:hypothetical protein